MRNKYIRRVHITESTFRKVLKHFSLDVPALVTSQLLAIRTATVQRLYSILRQRVQELALEEMKPLAGEIEVDESYFGARESEAKEGEEQVVRLQCLGCISEVIVFL